MKNGKKKKKVQTLKWATAHLSIRLGARGWALGVQVGALGTGVRGTARKHGARGAGRADGARWALGAGARHVSTWACCWASRLCTLCTQLVLTQF